MLKSAFKYLVVFAISVIISYQFHDNLTQLKLIPKGIVKLFFPEKKVRVENKVK